MRGTGSLLILLIAAVAAGVLLVVFKPDQLPRTDTQNGEAPSAEAYVEEILRLRFKAAPVLLPVPRETWPKVASLNPLLCRFRFRWS